MSTRAFPAASRGIRSSPGVVGVGVGVAVGDGLRVGVRDGVAVRVGDAELAEAVGVASVPPLGRVIAATMAAATTTSDAATIPTRRLTPATRRRATRRP
ncbi:hypothetical protein [Microbacterium testaceum]|uniref:hypothetical protein n=1 Tax=Microbacterium testaceum TaxID=2033 RepID=UPI001FA7CD21|nr:hypothetical protein [Microbacterium testaceum]